MRSSTHSPSLARQRWSIGAMANEVFTEAIERAALAGKSLNKIDAKIIEPAVLSRRLRALLLYAYSRGRGEQRRYARESDARWVEGSSP